MNGFNIGDEVIVISIGKKTNSCDKPCYLCKHHGNGRINKITGFDENKPREVSIKKTDGTDSWCSVSIDEIQLVIPSLKKLMDGLD